MVKELVKNGERPMAMSFVLRDFKDIDEQKIWFNFPLHFIDEKNLLENCHVEGSAEANFAKNPNRKSDDEKRRIIDNAFEMAGPITMEDGSRMAKTSDMAAYAETTEKTIKKYASEMPGYTVERGYIRKVNNEE